MEIRRRACHIATMTSSKLYYRVKIDDMAEMPIFVEHEDAFALELRAMLNGRESLRELGDDVTIVYSRPDGTIHQISVGEARRSR